VTPVSVAKDSTYKYHEERSEEIMTPKCPIMRNSRRLAAEISGQYGRLLFAVPNPESKKPRISCIAHR
jgi:hypothetical protein